jgi:hypothetical protein
LNCGIPWPKKLPVKLLKPAYIKTSCVISNHRITKDGDIVFETNDIDNLGSFLNSAYQFVETKYPKFYKMDHLSKLGWLAAEVLLKDSFDKVKYAPEDVGLVFMNASASLDADIKYYDSTKEIASPALFVYTLPNIVIGEISIRHNFKGENAFFIFEKFDPDFLSGYVSDLFENDIVQVCICGWIEVLGEAYKAVLYLVEKDGGTGPVLNSESLNKMYQS